MRALLLLFLTPAYALELPKAVTQNHSAFQCSVEKKTPLSKKYLDLAKSCIHEVCKSDQGPDANKYKRHADLSARYRKLVEKMLINQKRIQELELLKKQKSLDDFYYKTDVVGPAGWALLFESVTGYIDLLPEKIIKEDYTGQLRNEILKYSKVLESTDPQLSGVLNLLRIKVGYTKSEALAFFQDKISELEKGSPDEEALRVIANNALMFSTPWPETFFLDLTILHSVYSINSPFYLAIGVHEAAHLISLYVKNIPESSIAKSFYKIRALLEEIHPVPGGYFVEEDWADYLSAKITDKNLACNFMSVFTAKGLLDIIPSEKTTHSTAMYRMLAIEKNQKGKLPAVCEQAIQVRANEHCSK